MMHFSSLFNVYLGRLKVFAEVRSAVGEILVKIMIELLEVLALATQQIVRADSVS